MTVALWWLANLDDPDDSAPDNEKTGVLDYTAYVPENPSRQELAEGRTGDDRFVYHSHLMERLQPSAWTQLRAREVQTLHVMDDGVVRTRRMWLVLPTKGDTFLVEHVPWADVLHFDLRNETIKVYYAGPSGRGTLEIPEISRARRATLFDRLGDLRRQGRLPKHVEFEAPERGKEAGGKKKQGGKMSTVLGWVVILFIAYSGWQYLKDGRATMCEGRAQYVADQVPGALDTLSARHPLSVGFVRSLLNGKNGEADRVIQAVIAEVGDGDKTDPLACAKDAAVMHFAMMSAPDQMRGQIADKVEQALNLKGAP